MGTDITTLGESGIEALKEHSKILASSGLLPDHFKKYPQAVYAAVGLARSMGEDPLHVCQSIYFISGKPGWTSSFLLARLRRTKAIVGTVQYDITGEGEGLRVRVRAMDAGTGEEIVGPEASMEMAKADGWTKNSKYKSMPEVMLRNRALSFFVRYHYPDVMAGLPMADELQDVQAAGRAAPAERTGALAAIEADIKGNGQVIDAVEATESDAVEADTEADTDRKIGFEDTETQPLFEAGE